jgi:hypothetical protein
MPMEGDFAKLARLISNLEHIDESMPKVAKTAAETIYGLIQDEFNGGHDPYGTPWAPLSEATLRVHGPPPLTDSGDMRATLDVHGEQARDSGGRFSKSQNIVIEMDLPAAYHQHGTGKRQSRDPRGRYAPGKSYQIPPRKIWPDESDAAIPPSWEAALEEAANPLEDILRKAVG